MIVCPLRCPAARPDTCIPMYPGDGHVIAVCGMRPAICDVRDLHLYLVSVVTSAVLVQHRSMSVVRGPDGDILKRSHYTFYLQHLTGSGVSDDH